MNNIKRIQHHNIKIEHLYDDRHMKRNRNEGELLSGVQLLIKNIYETVCEKIIEKTKLQKALRYTNRGNRYPSPRRQNPRFQNSYDKSEYHQDKSKTDINQKLSQHHMYFPDSYAQRLVRYRRVPSYQYISEKLESFV